MNGSELKEWRMSRGYSRDFIAKHCGAKNGRTVEAWEQAREKPIPEYASKLITLLKQKSKMQVDLNPRARIELKRRADENGTSEETELARIIDAIFGILTAAFLISSSLALFTGEHLLVAVADIKDIL